MEAELSRMTTLSSQNMYTLTSKVSISINRLWGRYVTPCRKHSGSPLIHRGSAYLKANKYEKCRHHHSDRSWRLDDDINR
jgi:hypothetical protein